MSAQKKAEKMVKTIERLLRHLAKHPNWPAHKSLCLFYEAGYRAGRRTLGKR